MSVVVAIKERGNVYIGCDSQVTKGGSRSTLHNKNNYKIWKVDGCNHCIMGSVGNVRDANIVRLMDDLVSDYNVYKNQVDYRFVVRKVVPDILSELKMAGYIKSSGDYFENMESSFLFAFRNQLYEINNDGAVLEIDDYVAIGSGKFEAIGSLLSTEGQPTQERIIKAIKASATSDIYVDYPIIISNTKTTEFDVIDEKDEIKYISSNKQKKKVRPKDFNYDDVEADLDLDEYPPVDVGDWDNI
ncbi:MAG: hypothetical protein K6F14_02580 [Clostridiales bacterium]|nr:hypothetical protein [Clostridiales bacterium]